MSDEEHEEITNSDNITSNEAVLVSSDDGDVDMGMSAKETERKRIQAEIEAFLQQGGQITQVDTNVMTDPPKRPESNYGGQPI